MTGFGQAVRSLRKAPALAAVAIASLALGIGANVTVFSVVREMIPDDLSAWRPDRLARVEGMDISYAQYRQLRTAGAFEDLAFYRNFGDRIARTFSRCSASMPMPGGSIPKPTRAASRQLVSILRIW